MTTCPFYCPVSTYLLALAASSIGYLLSMTDLSFPASICSLRKIKSSGLSSINPIKAFFRLLILKEWNRAH
ncbi:MAG: hypothetical protein ACXACU_08430 [Candidatus Hodarchaeales archaeon]